MDLKTYITTNGIRHADFASRIGVTAQALYRYCSGDRLPRRSTMEKIATATSGAVQPNDFFARVTEPQAAA